MSARCPELLMRENRPSPHYLSVPSKRDSKGKPEPKMKKSRLNQRTPALPHATFSRHRFHRNCCHGCNAEGDWRDAERRGDSSNRFQHYSARLPIWGVRPISTHPAARQASGHPPACFRKEAPQSILRRWTPAISMAFSICPSLPVS